MDVYARKKDRSHCKIPPPNKTRIKWCLEKRPKAEWIPRGTKIVSPVQDLLLRPRRMITHQVKRKLSTSIYIQKRINYWLNHPSEIIRKVCQDEQLFSLFLGQDIKRFSQEKKPKEEIFVLI